MIEVACALIRNEKGEYLLVRRSEKMAHPLKWEFPGGKIRQGENPMQAIQREISEELAIEVLPLQVLDKVIWEYPEKKIGLVPVICEIRSGRLQLIEHCDFRWSAPARMGDVDLLEADKVILKSLKLEP